MGDFRVGIVLRQGDMEMYGRRLGELTARIEAAGIDHATVGDHVSFAGGAGADGLIQAMALLCSHPTLPVETGVYLITLRHPAAVARQLTTMCSIAPGRFTFGIGIGGDDRRELELCGVDPSRRGRRADEAIELLLAFMSGADVEFAGEFFNVERAAIRPAPRPRPRVLVGGRADGAFARAGRYADGWIGVWVSPRRFAEARERYSATAVAAGREDAAGEHVLQLWAGFGSDAAVGRAAVDPVMERAYGLPAARFERYVPCGTPAEVSAKLGPFVAAGARRFNIVPEAGGLEAAIEAVGAVKAQLQSEHEGASDHAPT